MTEIWKSLKGVVEYGDYYEISNMGNVRSIDRMVFNGKSHFMMSGKTKSQLKIKLLDICRQCYR